MTGAEHYAAGERLIEAVNERTDALKAEPGDRVQMTADGARAAMVMLAAAQAHFAAAHVAATVLDAGKLGSLSGETFRNAIEGLPR